MDAAGAITVSGNFVGTAGFGAQSLGSAGGRDAFVVRVDAQGETTWARRFGGAAADDAWDLALEPGGDLWVTGSFSEQAAFGARTLSSQGGTDIFVARLDGAGELVQLAQFGGAGLYDRGHAVALDGRGGAVLTGVFRDRLRFGATELVNESFNDVFVTLLDSTGRARWAGQVSGPDEDTVAGVATSGDVAYVLGSTGKTASFGETLLGGDSGYPMFLLSLPLP